MKRRWLQIHLSTAIVLTFLIALVLFVNIKHVTITGRPILDATLDSHNYGWPSVVCVVTYAIGDEGMMPYNPRTLERVRPEPQFYEWHLVYNGLLINVVMCLVLLGSFAAILEWNIRRRERGRLSADPRQ